MNGRHLNALRPSAGGRCCFRDEIRTPQPQAEKPDRAGVNCDTTPHRIGAKEHGLVFLDHPQTDVDFLEDLQIPCPCVEILRLWNAERNTAPEMPRALRKAAWARSTQARHTSSTASLGAAPPTRLSGPETRGESSPPWLRPLCNTACWIGGPQSLGPLSPFNAFFSPCDHASGKYSALLTRPSQTRTGEPTPSVNPLPRSEIQRESSPTR
jgi:hypothetical protein